MMIEPPEKLYNYNGIYVPRDGCSVTWNKTIDRVSSPATCPDPLYCRGIKTTTAAGPPVVVSDNHTIETPLHIVAVNNTLHDHEFPGLSDFGRVMSEVLDSTITDRSSVLRALMPIGGTFDSMSFIQLLQNSRISITRKIWPLCSGLDC